MINFLHVIIVLGFALAIALVEPVKTESVTAERTPLLHCQYSAGYGVAVFEYENIGDGLILTDKNEVFSNLVCEKWEKTSGKKESK